MEAPFEQMSALSESIARRAFEFFRTGNEPRAGIWTIGSAPKLSCSNTAHVIYMSQMTPGRQR